MSEQNSHDHNDELLRVKVELENKITKQSHQLTDANCELEAFCAAVSHDLRTPIRAIQIFASQLKNKLGEEQGTDTNQYIANIQQCTHEMNEMINSLLAFSRLSQQALLVTVLDMQGIVTGAVSTLANSALLEFDIKIGSLPNANADAAMIKNVWLNLISNAIKYYDKNTLCKIEISDEITEGGVLYKVSDNGVGFDMKYYDKLFQPFSRLHSTSQYKGSGMGLAISHRIIKKHGGEMWAEAKVGQGSTFCFSLPILQ